MEARTISFENSKTVFYFNGCPKDLKALIANRKVVFLTDEQVAACHPEVSAGFPLISVPAGEDSKSFEQVKKIIDELIALAVDKDALLIGLGGGVVCDLAGFVAGIYKRGISCAFIPTSVLAMVDAAVGGKNGINVGNYKNMVGLIRQPEFIFYDYSLLSSLPEVEWVNGFAEVIKHACIADKEMFDRLLEHNLSYFREHPQRLTSLIKDNALLKANFVQQDERETGLRKQLNFGHTLGHAIERSGDLKHGFAVALGMVFAALVSEKVLGFKDKQKVQKVLEQYDLPVSFNFEPGQVIELMQVDKKRNGDKIDFILLKSLGNAIIRSFHYSEISNYLKQ